MEKPWKVNTLVREATVPAIQCLKCGHKWAPRVEEPKKCPGCQHTINWDVRLDPDEGEVTRATPLASAVEAGDADLAADLARSLGVEEYPDSAAAVLSDPEVLAAAEETAPEGGGSESETGSDGAEEADDAGSDAGDESGEDTRTLGELLQTESQ